MWSSSKTCRVGSARGVLDAHPIMEAALVKARDKANASEVEDEKTLEARRTGCDRATCILPNVFVGPVTTAAVILDVVGS